MKKQSKIRAFDHKKAMMGKNIRTKNLVEKILAGRHISQMIMHRFLKKILNVVSVVVVTAVVIEQPRKPGDLRKQGPSI